jgi:3-isopropylmalate/(R)-2-methylmalate dehydratase large subunit
MTQPRTLAEKIIDAHTIEGEVSGVYRRVKIDALLGHDATIALLIDAFEKRGLSIWDPSRCLFTNDHFSPPATQERADISNKFLRFSRERRIGHLALDRGICHQLLVESPLCVPGALIVGADSHTIMGGGIGAASTGMGSTDIQFALATGTTWMRVPESIKVTFTGSMPALCSGRDVVLELCRQLGESGAQYASLEYHDHATPKLSQDQRFAIANMAIEAGAKFGIFVPDEVTDAYLEKRGDSHAGADHITPDAGAQYQLEMEFDLGTLTPRVAKPWSPANVVPLSSLEERPITVAFVGSCSSGRLEDLRETAEELAGKTIHPDVRFIVIPASIEIFKAALRAGYVETITEAGAVFNQSSCGPCGGIDKGVLGAEDVCVSTSNRNFRGRMGHWESQTFLASARTVARAAVHGSIGSSLYSALEDGNA